MRNLFISVLLGGSYFVIVHYAMDQGYIRRFGITPEDYTMLAVLTGLFWVRPPHSS